VAMHDSLSSLSSGRRSGSFKGHPSGSNSPPGVGHNRPSQPPRRPASVDRVFPQRGRTDHTASADWSVRAVEQEVLGGGSRGRAPLGADDGSAPVGAIEAGAIDANDHEPPRCSAPTATVYMVDGVRLFSVSPSGASPRPKPSRPVARPTQRTKPIALLAKPRSPRRTLSLDDA
jgi:hypothetical protein